MKLIALTLLLLVSNISLSQYSSPESVTFDSAGQRYLISNTSSSKIVQRSRQGVVSDFVTVGGSIHGVAIFNGAVYVCNGTRIKGYDMLTAAEVFNVTLTGSTFLNDLAIDNNGMIYISDFTNRRIYKLNSSNSGYWIYVPNTTNTPNGLYVDAPRNRLLICCWGGSAPIKAVAFADSSITNLITTPYSNCDGISLDRNDNVYVSTWGIQSIARYDINFANPPVIVASSLSNPADIFVNKATDTLAVPNAGNSTVSFYLLSIPSGINSNESSPPAFELFQNFPNPFNPGTVIRYSLVVSGFVKLGVYDVLGNEIETLVNEKQSAGDYELRFDAAAYPSGIYFYKIRSGENSVTRRMTLVK